LGCQLETQEEPKIIINRITYFTSLRFNPCSSDSHPYSVFSFCSHDKPSTNCNKACISNFLFDQFSAYPLEYFDITPKLQAAPDQCSSQAEGSPPYTTAY
jgi:hypothetical protein